MKILELDEYQKVALIFCNELELLNNGIEVSCSIQTIVVD